MDPVVHFEIPYNNSSRIAGFYEKAFGWETKALGEEMGNYVLATSAPVGEDGPTVPGTINGGFFPKRADMPQQHPSVVIAVENITDAMAKVRAAGGTVLGDPMEIPGVGKYVSFNDTEGNRLSMLQAIPRG
ncbi:MAG: VOC family protein [Pseudomonadota bacterium]